MKSNLTFLRIL